MEFPLLAMAAGVSLAGAGLSGGLCGQSPALHDLHDAPTTGGLGKWRRQLRRTGCR